MDARKFAGIIGTAVLLTAGLSQAGSAGHIEPLDGTQGVTRSVNEPGSPSERGRRLVVGRPGSRLDHRPRGSWGRA